MASEPPTTDSATTSHIPSFARQLLPYIKSRQEALRIRQVLTSYLRSQITFVEEDPERPNPHAESHLVLCAPHDAVVDVKRAPPELTGLRKEYLEALRANVAAKQENQSVSENLAAKMQQRRKDTAETTTTSTPNSELQTYLVLLRDRRRNAKLEVFQHHLQELKGRQTVELEQFDKTEDQNQHLLRIGRYEDGRQGDPGKEGVEGLVHKLERAVIRARAQLEREKKLFEELKAQHAARANTGNEDISSASKIQALQWTRDALVQWVEEKLMSVGANDEGPIEELSPEEIEDAANLLDERRTQIMQQYTTYVETRRALLETAAKSCQPVAPGPAKPREPSDDNDKHIAEEPLPLEPMDAMAFASERLLPLSKSQRGLSLQKSYLSGMLLKEKSTTLRALNRLADESHLLPEYPLLSRQPRFKHATSGATSGSRSSLSPRELASPDEITSLAEAWAFASGAAREHEQEYVAQKIVEGGETAHEALQTLEEICDTLGQDLQDVFEDAQESSADVQSRSKSSAIEKQAGPWSGLNGQVGVAK
ncbi:uncharacterized protein EURHEDRAFT_411946 [Aspergillus ruber CBS 135680]|uniref:Uncharacterized protein n=1 Tax=Aspergillus ruber (strain CBS 135680) TaxID=1388766 RepID=A0A017SFE5_ASPRC|nr:uncharacterized protein EURHEDRAFT_411946 [Aspergillus ruber CBS 135680]EYE95667.1 hypothetical protein EURHEDRAFT_411946 [Aspergillus ruber CBS 135680]